MRNMFHVIIEGGTQSEMDDEEERGGEIERERHEEGEIQGRKEGDSGWDRGGSEIRGEINTGSLGNEPPAISVRVDRVPPSRCNHPPPGTTLAKPPTTLQPRKRRIPHNKYRQLCNTAGITREEAPANTARRLRLRLRLQPRRKREIAKGEFDANSRRI